MCLLADFLRQSDSGKGRVLYKQLGLGGQRGSWNWRTTEGFMEKPSLKGRDLKWLNDGWMKNVYNGCRMVVGIALFLSWLN